MRVISYRPLREFGEIYRGAKAPLDAWFQIASKTEWRNLAEVRQTFRHADPVGDKTVFNIGGNKYRLITYINYEAQIVYVKHIMTHDEYDEENWKT